MVNTGKPSKGCYMCRARRIKCDEKKPHCMRCQKSKRICPGYRDAFEINLRDETASTKDKLSRSEIPSGYIKTGTGIQRHFTQSLTVEYPLIEISRGSKWSDYSIVSPTGSIESPSHSSMTRNTTVSMSISQHGTHDFISHQVSTSIGEQAMCFFLANFVLIPEPGTMRGHLHFVIPLLKIEPPNSALTPALSAVAIAALGTRPNSRSLLPKAHRSYNKALRQLNSALTDPSLSTDDSTLAAVLLLALFEQLILSQKQIRGWSSHMSGAVALLKSRGKKQFQTQIGRELFVAVRATEAIRRIGKSEPVPLGVAWWLRNAPQEDVLQTFADLNLNVAELRAETDKTTTLGPRKACNIEKVLVLLRRAETLEQQYQEWFNSLPSTWDVRTVAWVERGEADLSTAEVHPGRVDSYGEFWMAYSLNIARSSRLFIWTTILRCVAWLGGVERDYRITEEYTTASRVCSEIIGDIVSSIPFVFGGSNEEDASGVWSPQFACGTTDKSTPRGLAGLFVMWPIFSAASSDFATQSQRRYLRGRLTYIAQTMGINQAEVLLKAPLLHPSVYIKRERMSLRPQTCFDANVQESFNEKDFASTVGQEASPKSESDSKRIVHPPKEFGTFQDCVSQTLPLAYSIPNPVAT